MATRARYYQVHKLKIEFEFNTSVMTILSDEQIYEETNPQGDLPRSQVFAKAEEENSDDETSDRSESEDEPPLDRPRGQLLSPEEAARHSGLFENHRRERELFIRNVVRQLRPKVILLGRNRREIYREVIPSYSSENDELQYDVRDSSASSSSASSASNSSSEDDSRESDNSDGSDGSENSDSSDNDDPEEPRGTKRGRSGSHSSEGSGGKRMKLKSSDSVIYISSSDLSDED